MKTYDQFSERPHFSAHSEDSVASGGTTDLASVTIPDGATVQLLASTADLAAGSSTNIDRGYRVIAHESSNVVLARSAVGGKNAPPVIWDVIYKNDTGGDVNVVLEAFHASGSSEDMVGHQTWRLMATD